MYFGRKHWRRTKFTNARRQAAKGRFAKPIAGRVGREFRGNGEQFPGIPVTELSHDQRGNNLEKTLTLMLSPYRAADHDAVLTCLNKQGGIDKCSLAFYSDEDVGDDGVWDNWRLEGPSFVWYFRGSPHVHLWVNIGDDSSIATNAQG